MARPQRNNVDYFPFYCEEGKKMFYLEETYGNDGFAVFLKILRELAKTDFHYLDLSKNTTLMFLSAKCKVTKEILLAIINDLVELEKFDKVLWSENSIVWCQDFIDSIQDAYNKRSNECITYEGLVSLLISLGVRKPIKVRSKVDVNPQTILEDNKVNKSKVNIYSDEIKNFTHSLLSLFSIPLDNKEKAYKDIELLLTKDNYTKEKITQIVKYFRQDEFWAKNFQSILKLRKKNKEGIKYIDYFNGQLQYSPKTKMNDLMERNGL
jgi:hypothetical protein